jgi:hypothetical protein
MKGVMQLSFGVVFVLVLIHAIDVQAKDTRRREEWFASNGAIIKLYEYNDDAVLVKPDGSQIQYKYKVTNTHLIFRNAHGAELPIPYTFKGPNTLVLPGMDGQLILHRISGDWYSKNEQGERVLRLSPQYQSITLYLPDLRVIEGGYSFDGKYLKISTKGADDNTGTYAVKLDGETMTLASKTSTRVYQRLGNFLDAVALRVIRAWDPSKTTHMGLWRTESGEVWEVREQNLSLYLQGKEYTIASYQFDGRTIAMKNWSNKPRLQARFAARFVHPNLMIWSGPDGEKRLYYQGEHRTRSIGMYDIDQYRIGSDYFKGQAPGGSNSWCLPDCGFGTSRDVGSQK